MASSNAEIQKDSTGTAARAEPSRDVPVYIPAADIYETATDILVIADMPGVDDQHVEVKLENDVLEIAGRAVPDEVEGHEAIYRGYAAGDYRRAFTITDGVDRAGIKARIKDGVMRITLPKSERLQAKSIKVESG